MGNMISLLLSFGLVITPTPKITAEVVKVTENEKATVGVYTDYGYQKDVNYFDFSTREISEEVGQPLSVKQIYGTFYGTVNSVDGKNEKTKLYQFKSYDDSFWWTLSADDIGFIPINGKPYVLAFNEGGSTKENHKCPTELNCDCYSYDDLFLGVYDLR